MAKSKNMRTTILLSVLVLVAILSVNGQDKTAYYLDTDTVIIGDYFSSLFHKGEYYTVVLLEDSTKKIFNDTSIVFIQNRFDEYAIPELFSKTTRQFNTSLILATAAIISVFLLPPSAILFVSVPLSVTGTIFGIVSMQHFPRIGRTLEINKAIDQGRVKQ